MLSTETVCIVGEQLIRWKAFSLKRSTSGDPPFLHELRRQRKAINDIFHNLIDFLIRLWYNSDNNYTSGLKFSR